MVATSKDILFPRHNHLLTTSTTISTSAMLADGYDLEERHF